MKKILCIVGTRPEAIKMAPVINLLKSDKSIQVRVLATAQHRQMLDQVLNIFNIEPDLDLDVMRPNQDLTTLTARLLNGLNDVLIVEKPDIVLAQGDTTTVFTAALASFYHKIPFGHIEAGLRTWDINNPFPEEMNRVLVSKITNWHFAPTERSKLNLLAEGVQEDRIFVTGNTVIDALFSVIKKSAEISSGIDPIKRLILVTVHRRENFGKPFEDICAALITLLENNSDIQVLFPVHPNPNIQEYANKIFGGHPRIVMCKPLDYLPFINAMQRAFLILSDSGGVQEEAPALGKPVLVLREATERPEAVETGAVKLIGVKYEVIVSEVQKLLDDNNMYESMLKGGSPYGDGRAASRIIDVLHKYFDKQKIVEG
ncbi:non-hydrolyzing UDP-N-acetylglucosamine 2-epimerase [Polynucleobacter sp. MG-27-Goln-C1]|uniref:non-hydrolyzing UDP-N-acetylglucosamine 2-epimerase n=1 Tax=Polynucleobacter sp. MG-27-Goln-C1 TaxID=1819726 RepID=UPI001C0E01A3|nr:UDP-N-acetylglucosamine 2-epimerase (non-hydrolyzing) [Polynucleobacter sp. MG-27-Goln-C1]MBU3612858.1 UDP-N-acetylglucosamine 2-epimerase (non-hydrolyzing) [Polynucleobacter sp. MG-27-Goln-C1]